MAKLKFDRYQIVHKKSRIRYLQDTKTDRKYYLDKRSTTGNPTLHTIRFCLFLCYCGTAFEARLSDVRSGNTRSCGCRWYNDVTT